MNDILLALELTGCGLGGVFFALILFYILVRVTRNLLQERK